MQHQESTTQQPLPPRARLEGLQPGDYVLVWDGVKSCDIWQRLAELRTAESGRLKLRVEGTDFFFDEGLVISTVRSAPPPTPTPAASLSVRVIQGPHGAIGVFVQPSYSCHAQRRDAA
jgi:hypothetical protein